MARERHRRQTLIRVGGGLVAVALLVGFVWFVQRMMSLKISRPERQVQNIQLIRPPPPPPPPPDQPPPPPPPKVEQTVQQDKPEPTPDQPDQQAPDVLANDGPASAGGDSFGMHQGSGGVIGGSGTAPFAWYTNRMRDQIKEKLSDSSCIKSAKGSISTQIVVDPNGRVKHIELTTKTGNAQVDGCLIHALSAITQVGADPPPGMPEAINLKVVF